MKCNCRTKNTHSKIHINNLGIYAIKMKKTERKIYSIIAFYDFVFLSFSFQPNFCLFEIGHKYTQTTHCKCTYSIKIEHTIKLDDEHIHDKIFTAIWCAAVSQKYCFELKCFDFQQWQRKWERFLICNQKKKI